MRCLLNQRALPRAVGELGCGHRGDKRHDPVPPLLRTRGVSSLDQAQLRPSCFIMARCSPNNSSSGPCCRFLEQQRGNGTGCHTTWANDVLPLKLSRAEATTSVRREDRRALLALLKTFLQLLLVQYYNF